MVKFIINKKTNFVIYLDDNATKNSVFSANIFKKYIYLSTGVDLKIINNKPESNYLYFDSSCLESNGGVSVEASDDVVRIRGDGEFGCSNATIELLFRLIGFDVISQDNIVYKKANSLTIKSFKFTPTFSRRISTYGWVRNNEEFKLLTRTESATDVFAFGNIYHNALDILKYNNTEIKDEYLSSEKDQLCYSNKTMESLFISNLKKYIGDSSKCNPNNKYFVVGMEDNIHWCNCDKCSKLMPSDLMVSFINNVESKINKDRENKIVFILFAYYNTLKAPLVKCNENVGVYFAPIKARFRQKLSSNDNLCYLTELEKWSKQTKHLFAWTYNFYTRRNLIMYDTFGSIKDNYRLLKNNKVSLIYDQTESYSLNQTGFSNLKLYVQQKLQWNVNQNINKLIKNYFKFSYGNFNKEMLSIFKNTREMYRFLYKNENINLYVNLDDSSEIKYSEIGQCIDKFEILKNENVKEKFNKFLIKTNNNFDIVLSSLKDEKIKERVLLESISYRFLYLNLFDTENEKGFNQLFEDIKILNIEFIQEGRKIGKNIVDIRL